MKAGADITKTNSFGTSSVVLAEYDIALGHTEISKKSAEIAKEVANDFSTNGWPRFVAGVVGPTTKLLTLRHINFDTMHASYVEAMCGLIDGESRSITDRDMSRSFADEMCGDSR